MRPKTHCKHGHEFTPENTYVTPKTGWRNCRTCIRKKGCKYREVNSAHCRDMQLQLKYGISIEEYDQILKSQDGRCAICGCLPKRKSLGVDHKHTPNAETIRQSIRGLLCHRCNTALGLLNECHETAQRAADYLALGTYFSRGASQNVE